jgi:hypothetical protein
MRHLESIIESETVRTIDLCAQGTIVLYTPPLRIYDLPEIGASVHLHGSSDGNYLYGGDVRPIGFNEPFIRLNSYECAMADYYLSNVGIKPIEPE